MTSLTPRGVNEFTEVDQYVPEVLEVPEVPEVPEARKSRKSLSQMYSILISPRN